MRAVPSTTAFDPALLLWLVVGWIGYAVLPWYGLDQNFFLLGWLLRVILSAKKLRPHYFSISKM